MFSFFPTPYPDELLYSVCARFNDRARYSSVGVTIEELFGTKNASAVVDLPCRLNVLVSRLPRGHSYTTDRLINEHTLLPFYAPFLTPERLNNSKEDMRGVSGNHLRERLGITAGRLRPPEYLRFCPTCVTNEREEYGETFWHRIHQVSGVEVCIRHAVLLESSNVLWKDRRSPSKFTSAERVINTISPRSLELADAHHSILLKIASDATWLLHQHNLNFGPEILRSRYYNLLLEHGYAYYNGRIRTSKLLKDFINFYSPNLLKRLGCPINSKEHSWVTRLLLKDKATVVQHPLRHLLLITFLNLTAESLFTYFTEFKPFGDSPWPCLNHASDHFQQEQITECRVVDSRVKGKAGGPRGIFTCHCGFTYTRMGRDRLQGDRLRMDSVQSYGAVWNSALRNYWADNSLTIRGIARRLAVYEATVVRQAIRLGLRYPRDVLRMEVSKEDLPRRKIIIRQPIEDALEDRRREWLKLIQAKPTASRNDLISAAYYLYFWLRRNDLTWLEGHIPFPRNTYRRVSLIDWQDADIKLSASVKVSAQRIKSLPGRPIRASITSIIKEVGNRSWLEKRLDKLPLTAKVIREDIESLEAFAIRKVLWTTERYLQDAICPTRAQFTVRARVRNKTGKTPLVQNALNTAMERLREELS